MDVSFGDLLLAGALYYGIDWVMNWSEAKDEVPTDLETQRVIQDLKTAGGGDPGVINNLKYQLMVRGIKPQLRDPKDPVRTEADLILQTEKQSKKMFMDQPSSTGLVNDRSPKTPGNLILNYRNLAKSQTTLQFPVPEEDGNS
jgi:hypothetical protein